jgi:2C-methyl-D-erythritol 2,4-cyclodiphosphate synthase
MIISDIDQYKQEIIDGNLILTKKIKSIGEGQLLEKELSGMKIVKCKINNIDINLYTFRAIIINLYHQVNRNILLQTKTLNISQEEKNENGFKYYPSLKISVQYADSPKTLKAIITIIKLQNYNMEMTLKLKNKNEINYDEIVCLHI